MVQFHHLCQAEEDLFNASFMLTCRQAAVPALTRSEEQAVFTYTKFLDRHQLNFPFSHLEEELLFQIEQTWGFILFPEDIRLTWPDGNGHSITLPPEMFVREFLDIHCPDWHREQDLGSHYNALPRAFTARNQPYVSRIDCRSNRPDPPAASP